uniref:LITAF domain-containing protein n=1 Tax=Pseudo-nitzschia australis TaxID=44445 RepID=A0A7S4AEH2_9STRA|mmetsp:Transcript_17298/g.37898  ORF Transcript_17298/g.37898 Transcript_17298/m.37898 type:complete len:270 (-) Transcript_17298:439-1248(-)
MRGHKNNRIKTALMLLLARPTWTANTRSNGNHYRGVASAAFATLSLSNAKGFIRGRRVINNIDTNANTRCNNNNNSYYTYRTHRSFISTPTPTLLFAKPKKAGSAVDNYQTISVNCNTCRERLFRYKKKNGTKSNLVKCYVERICEDSAGILARAAASAELAVLSPTAGNDGDGRDDRDRDGNSNNEDTQHWNNKNKNERKNGKRNQPNKAKRQTATTTATVETTIPKSLDPGYSWECPKCHTKFARSSLIHGRPALKMIGGKIRMTKK